MTRYAKGMVMTIKHFLACQDSRDGETGRLSFPKYFLVYTIVTLFLFGVTFGYFVLHGKSLVWKVDGLKQHYTALLYYSNYLQDIVRTLIFERRLEIPLYSYSLGYGSDILSTLHYYAIGEPLTLLSVFVPDRFMGYFYNFLCVFRIYLAGLSFSCYCFGMKQKNACAVLAGSIVYAFSGYAMIAAYRHPFFVIPMIYLPLLLLGIERVLKKQKPGLFIAVVALSAISNFYFFYMLVALAVIYVVFRVFAIYGFRRVKEIAGAVLRLAVYSVNGVLISAAILLPVLLLLASDKRADSQFSLSLYYNPEFYKTCLSNFLLRKVNAAAPSWTYLEYVSIALLALLFLFLLRKKHTGLKIGILLATFFLLFPAAGYALNGFAYPSNRWIWGYSFLIAYILVAVWDDLFAAEKKTLLSAAALLAVYTILAVVLDRKNAPLLIGIVMFAFAGVAALYIRQISKQREGDGTRFGAQRMQQLFLLLIVLNVGCNGFIDYHLISDVSIYSTVDQKKLSNKQFLAGETAAVLRTAPKDRNDYYRYSANFTAFFHNASLNAGISSTDYQWSLDNGAITDYRASLSLLTNSAYNYRELDERTALNALACVRYFVTEQDADASHSLRPYGFAEASRHGNYIVYENQFPLPLGYTYSSVIDADTFDALTPAQKEDAMLDGIVLEESPDGFKEAQLKPAAQNISYQITCGKNVKQKDHTFVVKKNHAKATLTFEGMTDAETSLTLQNFRFENKDNTKILIGLEAQNTDEEAVTKNLTFYTPQHKNYNNRHEFLINFGYDERAKTQIEITFPVKGTYSYDDIIVACRPMEGYGEKIAALGEDVLDNIEIGTNQISGTIELQEPKILCISLPYSKGWRAYVDGEKTTALKGNKMFLAIPLGAGSHQIALSYMTPGLKAGIVLSAVGLLMLLLPWAIRRGAGKS